MRERSVVTEDGKKARPDITVQELDGTSVSIDVVTHDMHHVMAPDEVAAANSGSLMALFERKKAAQKARDVANDGAEMVPAVVTWTGDRGPKLEEVMRRYAKSEGERALQIRLLKISLVGVHGFEKLVRRYLAAQSRAQAKRGYLASQYVAWC